MTQSGIPPLPQPSPGSGITQQPRNPAAQPTPQQRVAPPSNPQIPPNPADQQRVNPSAQGVAGQVKAAPNSAQQQAAYQAQLQQAQI
ncbi:MAG: type IV pili twitching motility protein PilT, partial [Pseudanabaena sp.]